MTLTHSRLIINKGDSVSFRSCTNEGDDVYLTGEVTGKIEGNILIVNVNEFLTCTIAARSVNRVNNLFINFMNFKDSLDISIGV